MKRAIWITVLAILGFASILLVRLPASWLKGWLPPGVACSDLGGTAWSGACSGLTYNGAPLGNLSWELYPSALLRAKVAAFVDLSRGNDFVRGDVEAGSGGNVVVHDLQAQMPLYPPILPELDSGLSGTASVNLAYVRLENRIVRQLEGNVETTSLVSRRERMPIGSYSLTFPKADPQSEPVGQIRSLEGPVDFEGTLQLTAAPGWKLRGEVRTRPDTPPQVSQQLNYLPPAPGANGTRLLEAEGTF